MAFAVRLDLLLSSGPAFSTFSNLANLVLQTAVGRLGVTLSVAEATPVSGLTYYQATLSVFISYAQPQEALGGSTQLSGYASQSSTSFYPAGTGNVTDNTPVQGGVVVTTNSWTQLMLTVGATGSVGLFVNGSLMFDFTGAPPAARAHAPPRPAARHAGARNARRIARRPLCWHTASCAAAA